jgi:HNH endonuclease
MLSTEERRERNRARQRRWRARNLETARRKAREYMSRWRAEHPEQARMQRREQMRRWYAEHPEMARKSARRWREEHLEQSRERARLYCREHPEKALERTRRYCKKYPERKSEQQRRRRALKSGATISDFTASQWAQMQIDYGWQCYLCRRLCATLTQDHIIPLSRGGNHTADNISPACHSCNCRKGNRAA